MLPNRNFQAALLLAVLMTVLSCNNREKVPPPTLFTEYPQPDVFPLTLSNPTPLQWDTISRKPIRPSILPFNLSELPSQSFDFQDFKLLPEPPIEVDFDFSSLESRPFDLEQLPEHKLKIETEVLPTPEVVQKSYSQRVKGTALDLQKWQQLIGSNVTIYQLAEDATGIIWIATTSGIFSFDGKKISNYYPNEYFHGIYPDKDGNVWAIKYEFASGRKIVHLNFKQKTIQKMSIDTIPPIMPHNLTLLADNKILVSSAKEYPFILNTDSMSIQKLDSAAGFLNSHYYYCSTDKDNRIWLSSLMGIEVIDPKKKKIFKITRKDGLIHDSVTHIMVAPNNEIWLTSFNHINSIDTKKGKLRRYKIREIPFYTTFDVMMDKENNVWVCANEGSYILDTKSNLVKKLILPGEQKEYQNIAISLIENRMGDIIIAGFSSFANSSTIYTIRQYGKTVYPFGNADIISTTEDENENLWIGTGNGLFIVDSSRKKFITLDVSHGLANQFVQSVVSRDGKIIIHTNYGFNIYDPEKHQLLRIGKKEGLDSLIIYSLMPGFQASQWTAASSDGIIQYDESNNLTLQLKKAGGLNGNFINAIESLPDQRLLSFTYESDPAIIDPVKNTIQFIEGIPENYLSNAHKATFIDSKGRIWIATVGKKSGLFMFDSEIKNVTRLSKNNGLSSDEVSSILEYQDKIVVTASEKVNILTPPGQSPDNKWQVSFMANSDNLKKNSNSYISDAITKSGHFIYGDVGLAIIYGIAPDTTHTTTYIKGLTVMGKAIDFTAYSSHASQDSSHDNAVKRPAILQYVTDEKIRWDSISGPFHLPANLSLPFNKNTIQIHFGEVSSRIDEAEYAYVLEGIDKSWSFTKNTHTENYLNLDPGHYTFKVSGRAASGLWSDLTVYSFTIRAPWYATWWAYTLYTLMAVCAIWVLVSMQKRSAIARERNAADIREAQLKADAENERRKNLEIISDMGRDITSSLSFRKIIDTVYGHVNKLMDASVFGIGIFDKEKNQLFFPATKEKGETLPEYAYSIDDKSRPAVWCFQNEKKVFSNDFQTEFVNYVPELARTAAGDHVKSLVYVPLMHKEKCLGVLTAQSFTGNAYNDYHLNILNSLATYAAVAIDNADAYRNLQAAQNQLIQAEKMASLGELTAGIAHEIQNPLNFVNNFSEVSGELIDEMYEDLEKGNLEEVLSLAKDIKQNLEKINYHGKRADSIVKGMLQHSRGTIGQKEPTNINNIADEYLRLSFHGLRAKDKSFNAKFAVRLDENIPLLNVVPQDIGRVMLNLFNNAFYAVNEKRKTAGEAYEPRVILTTKRSGNMVELSVEDNGNGMRPEIAGKIFQPFFTTKPTGRGTGLGLSLSYDIIKAHGGSIHVDSVENTGQTGHPSGTTLTIQLPVG